MKHLSLWVMLTISAFLTAGGADAQPATDYPTKAIRMIVPFRRGAPEPRRSEP